MNRHSASRVWRALIFGAALAAASACASSNAPRSVGPGYDIEAAARGRVLAENVCSACHAVAPHQLNSPNPAATPFQTLADTPGITASAINAWMHTSHPTMPNFIITSGQTDDIVAYLESLSQHRSAQGVSRPR